MKVSEYKKRVIDLFKSENATQKQWEELGEAILYVSESNSYHLVENIDKVLDPNRELCVEVSGYLL